MKILLNVKLCALFVCLLSLPVFAEDNAPTDTMMCTRDFNQWGYPSNCRCGFDEFYNQKIGECVAINTDTPDKFPVTDVKPEFTRCTKDLNRWGHSGNCDCRSADHEYNPRLGRCEERSPEDEDPRPEFVMGCEGGSLSPDGLSISCPDGSVFEKVDNTLENLSRSLAETIEERYQDQELDSEYTDQAPLGVLQ